jgi:uncharacterized membrane protein
MTFITEFIISLLVFGPIDLIYITQVAPIFFGPMIKNIQGSPIRINYLAAFIAYILLAASIPIFILPNIRKNSALVDSLFYGGLMGLFVYGIYDMTNKATIKGWKWSASFIDILWGMTVYSLSSYIIYNLT